MLFLDFYLCFFLIFILFADIINVKQQFRHILFRKWGEKGYFIDIYKILLFCLQPQAAYPGKYPRLKSFKGLYETSGTFLPHISTSPLWHNIAIKLWEKLEKLWSFDKILPKILCPSVWRRMIGNFLRRVTDAFPRTCENQYFIIICCYNMLLKEGG